MEAKTLRTAVRRSTTCPFSSSGVVARLVLSTQGPWKLRRLASDEQRSNSQADDAEHLPRQGDRNEQVPERSDRRRGGGRSQRGRMMMMARRRSGMTVSAAAPTRTAARILVGIMERLLRLLQPGN